MQEMQTWPSSHSVVHVHLAMKACVFYTQAVCTETALPEAASQRDIKKPLGITDKNVSFKLLPFLSELK